MSLSTAVNTNVKYSHKYLNFLYVQIVEFHSNLCLLCHHTVFKKNYDATLAADEFHCSVYFETPVEIENQFKKSMVQSVKCTVLSVWT